MNNSQTSFIKYCIDVTLMGIFQDAFEREWVKNNIIDDVTTDIIETADENFNSDDVRIAVARTLLNKLGYYND